MLTKILMVVCGILALTHKSWWCGGVCFFFILDRLDYWHYYHSRPWRKLHFPLMRLYARCAGIESGLSQATGRDFDVKHALFTTLKQAQPTWSDERITEFVTRQAVRCEQFEDARLIVAELKRRNANLDDTRLRELIAKARSQFTLSDPGVFVRFIVAGIIEQQYGESQRGEYLVELLRGRAS
jgi:hypothetical protein